MKKNIGKLTDRKAEMQSFSGSGSPDLFSEYQTKRDIGNSKKTPQAVRMTTGSAMRGTVITPTSRPRNAQKLRG